MEDKSRKKELTEKQRIRKNKQLNNFYAIIDKGKARYITFTPACIAIGASSVTFIKHGLISGIIGFCVCFIMAHIYYRSSWNNINKSAKKLKRELLGN